MKKLKAYLVDLHSVRVLEDEEFALRSDQASDGVNHFSISPGLSWDLKVKQPLEKLKVSETWFIINLSQTLTGVSLSPPWTPL